MGFADAFIIVFTMLSMLYCVVCLHAVGRRFKNSESLRDEKNRGEHGEGRSSANVSSDGEAIPDPGSSTPSPREVSYSYAEELKSELRRLNEIAELGDGDFAREFEQYVSSSFSDFYPLLCNILKTYDMGYREYISSLYGTLQYIERRLVMNESSANVIKDIKDSVRATEIVLDGLSPRGDASPESSKEPERSILKAVYQLEVAAKETPAGSFI